MMDKTMMINALQPGSKSSELKLAKSMMFAGVLLAVASSLGKVPFTPDNLTAYLANIITNAAEWSKALMPWATIIFGGYQTSRHNLKSLHIKAIERIIRESMTIKKESAQ